MTGELRISNHFFCPYPSMAIEVFCRSKQLIRLPDASRIHLNRNPDGVEGRIDGGIAMSLGYALSEAMIFGADGSLLNGNLRDYHIFRADEMPLIARFIVPTCDPAGPFGAKAAAEFPADGVAPAVINAIYDATGVRLHQIPATPERVWRALKEKD